MSQEEGEFVHPRVVVDVADFLVAIREYLKGLGVDELAREGLG